MCRQQDLEAWFGCDVIHNHHCKSQILKIVSTLRTVTCRTRVTNMSVKMTYKPSGITKQERVSFGNSQKAFPQTSKFSNKSIVTETIAKQGRYFSSNGKIALQVFRSSLKELLREGSAVSPLLHSAQFQSTNFPLASEDFNSHDVVRAGLKPTTLANLCAKSFPETTAFVETGGGYRPRTKKLFI